MVTCPAYVVPVHGPGDRRGPLHRHHHGHAALLAARRALRTQAAEISRAANQTSQSRSVLKVKAPLRAVKQEKAIALEGAYSVIVKTLPMVK